MTTKKVLSTLLTLFTLVGIAGKTTAAENTPIATLSQSKENVVSPNLAKTQEPEGFANFIESLKTQARQQGISDETIKEAFARIHFIARAIQSDRRQPEKITTLDQYLARVISPEKIREGQANYQRYQSSIDAISQKYGVPAQYIVALWAMESHFGRLQGKEDLISALATLAFEGRRQSFFTKELIAALKIIQEGHIAASAMKGSWAGAMGQNQFMPTTFLSYAVDGDGDGKIDIWNNPHDVFASTANYLSKEGWKKNESWGESVTLPKTMSKTLMGIKKGQQKTLKNWLSLGVKPKRESDAINENTKLWLIQPDVRNPERAFLVTNNFRVLMRWNRSYHFGVSVGEMADAISNK